jgi:hypothetical protein
MSESKITCTELGKAYQFTIQRVLPMDTNRGEIDKALRKIEQAADQAFAEIPVPEAEGPKPIKAFKARDGAKGDVPKDAA